MNNCRKNSTLKTPVAIYKIYNDGLGNEKEDKSKNKKVEFFKEYAIVKTSKGIELIDGNNNILTLKTHKLTFQYNSQTKQIIDKNWILFNNKFYKIDQISNTDEKNVEIIVYCSFIENEI